LILTFKFNYCFEDQIISKAAPGSNFYIVDTDRTMVDETKVGGVGKEEVLAISTSAPGQANSSQADQGIEVPAIVANNRGSKR
jgi:hypothetical protein